MNGRAGRAGRAGFAALLILAAALAGCGIKGDPVPPSQVQDSEEDGQRQP
ncbi:MAG: lipoprotein [Pseudomonadota bacterium]